MNSRQIEIFHAIMRQGTVTEAAAKLGITQPAVTASLKQIEAALGFNLFHRAGGRLHPTAEATILYSEAKRIQDNLDTFKKLAARLKDDLTAHLRIAAPPVFSHDLIPEAIAKFTGETKSTLIDITTQHHDDILKDIASSVGHNNLAITFGLDERAGSSAQLGSIPIGKSEIVALIPASWHKSQKPTVSVTDFAGKPMVGTFTGEPLGNAVERLLENTGVASDYVVRVHNHSVAANLVSKQVGAAFVDNVTAAYAQRYYDKHSFIVRPLENAPPLDVTAVYSYEHPLNKNAKRFVDIFRTCFRQQ